MLNLLKLVTRLVTIYPLCSCIPVLLPPSLLSEFYPPFLFSLSFCLLSNLYRQRIIGDYLNQWSDSGASFSFLSSIILSSLSHVIVRIWYHKSILFTLLKSPPIYSMFLYIIYFRTSLSLFSIITIISSILISSILNINYYPILSAPYPISSCHNPYLYRHHHCRSFLLLHFLY